VRGIWRGDFLGLINAQLPMRVRDGDASVPAEFGILRLSIYLAFKQGHVVLLRCLGHLESVQELFRLDSTVPIPV
jgi:hypothetical protein